jgi:hypothetical protein
LQRGSRTSSAFPESVVGDWWRYLVSAVGGLLLVVGVGSVLLDGTLTETELLQVASLVFSVRYSSSWGARIALGALGAWAHIVVPTVTSPFQMALLFLSVLAAGALFGAVVGYYNVRVRTLVERTSRESARREFLDEQRAALSTLRDDYTDVSVAVDGDTDAAVMVDELLYLTISEVLDNAVAHGVPPVGISVDAGPERVVVAVGDTGDEVTLPAEPLFDPNTRGRPATVTGSGSFSPT